MAARPTPIRPVASRPLAPEIVNEEVSAEKLAAWAHVREVWKHSKGRITQELLDAEYEAANTD